MRHSNDILKKIPHVDKLMKHKIITDSGVYRHEAAEAVREVLAKLREKILAGEIDDVPDEDELAQNAVDLAAGYSRRGIRRVINGTGVILHSNLGRANLSKAAAQAAADAASSYCTLEYDPEKGARGSRTACVEDHLNKLTGSEASLVVNNNAAAVLLILSAVAGGGNVIISRGELVEIGGGFRVPDIISQCGGTLREVGTTNKTRLADYENAIDADTKALLKVHTSNFKIMGFTESVTVKELAALGKSRGIPVVEDIGSGALTDMRKYGIHDEPYATESLKNGADIVSFSGDKLLGGPQCGIVLGKKTYISAMKKHPLYRALRVDKMTIAALEATLRVYADPVAAEREIPVLSMISLSEEALRLRAEELCKGIHQYGGNAGIVSVKSVAGGGSVPGLELTSYAVAPACKESAAVMDQRLREFEIPVIGYIEDDRLLLDVRTINEDDFQHIINAITEWAKNY